jgi:hypothetical protein
MHRDFGWLIFSPAKSNLPTFPASHREVKGYPDEIQHKSHEFAYQANRRRLLAVCGGYRAS